MMFDDCISKTKTNKKFGHVPFSWSKLADKILQFPNHGIRVIVTGKQVNWSAEFGLEVPVDYIFLWRL